MGFDVFMGMGTVCYKKNQFNEAIENYTKALSIAEQTADSTKQFVAREKIARCYYWQNDIIGAMRHLTLLTLSAPSSDDLIRIIGLKGICLDKLGQFDQAITTIRSLQQFDSEVAQRKMLLNLGSIYMRRGLFLNQAEDFEVANEYLFTALETTNDSLIHHKIYRNLGICFNYQGEFLQSLDYFDKALNLTNNDDTLITYTFHEMANSLINLGDMIEARKLLDFCLTTASKYNDQHGLGLTHTQLGHLSFKEDNPIDGEENFHTAIDYFLRTNSFAEIADCYKNLKEYFTTINPSAARIYAREHQHYLHKLTL